MQSLIPVLLLKSVCKNMRYAVVDSGDMIENDMQEAKLS